MTNTNTPPAGNISAAPRYKARWLTVCGFFNGNEYRPVIFQHPRPRRTLLPE